MHTFAQRKGNTVRTRKEECKRVYLKAKWVRGDGDRGRLETHLNIISIVMLLPKIDATFFIFKGKKTMWIFDIFCEERKSEKALDPKPKENQRLEF